jgi:anti-repressor protein
MNDQPHNPFPTVTEGRIGEAAVQTVNARDLHHGLEVSTAFKDWIVRRIADYGFQEEKDFCSFLSESSGGRPAKEYALTIDMAKELSMVERNDAGKRKGTLRAIVVRALRRDAQSLQIA